MGRVEAAACVDESTQYERVRASRSLRCWTDPDGAGRIDIHGPVDCTARVMKTLAPYERELFEQARVDGRRVTVVRVDHAALIRGETRPGEVCEIVDGGPVPVTVAQRMLEDSFVTVVLVDGTDVPAVSHLGRTIPAKLRTTVEELHRECDVEGCNVTHNLEIDHNQPLEEGGPTRGGTWAGSARITTSTSTAIGYVSTVHPAACASCRRTSGCRDVEHGRDERERLPSFIPPRTRAASGSLGSAGGSGRWWRCTARPVRSLG